MRVATTATAVFLWNTRAQHAHFTGLQPGFAVHVVLFDPARFVGHQFFGGEAANRLLKQRHVFGHPRWSVVAHLHPRYWPVPEVAAFAARAPVFVSEFILGACPNQWRAPKG
ncbi:hypothetical protein D3C76_1191330 [compost metagenome]